MVNPRYQSQIHHGLTPAISVFSPYNDTINVTCDDANYTTVTFNAIIGINMITIPINCIGRTKELMLYPSTYTSNSNIYAADSWNLNLAAELSSLLDDISVIHDVNTSRLSEDWNNILKENNIESLNLGEVKNAVESMSAIKTLKEFSVTKINFENPHHAATTITSWLVAACTLAIIAITAKLCCCGPQTSCLKCIFKSVWNLIKLIGKIVVHGIYMCARKPVPNAFKFDKKANKVSKTKDKVKWKITLSNNRALLTASLSSGRIFYNHVEGVIENEDGNMLKGLDIYPSADSLNNYLRVLNTLDVPELTSGSLLVNDHNVFYNPQTRQYLHVETQRPMYGFKLPAPTPV
jgi:hypothetical protein